MVRGKLNEAIEDAPGAMSDNSSHATQRAPSRDNIKAYYLKPDLTDRLDELMARWGVGQSELVAWLLSHALADVESGSLKPTWETKKRAKLL